MNLPKDLKIETKALLRRLKDVVSGSHFKFTKKRKIDKTFSPSIKIIQEIKTTETVDAKIFNLSRAADLINQYVILPNEVFSFWHVIGNPKNGFKKGRTITKGVLTEEIGGGLCQVSGIMYHLSLLAGVEVLERHNHSIDLYNAQTRYTPLGTDATVVYGYRDLRLKNNFNFPISFQLLVSDTALEARLCSTQQIKEKKLRYDLWDEGQQNRAKITDEAGLVLNESVYKKL